jgi:PAS domain-containing protein
MREECDEAELTLSPVFQANPLPTSITTLDEGRYVGVNDSWVQLFGYACQEAMGNTRQSGQNSPTNCKPMVRCVILNILHGRKPETCAVS